MPTKDADQDRRALSRHEVRRYLAERPVLAFSTTTVRQRLNSGHQGDWTDAEIEAAIQFLRGLKQIDAVQDGLGASKCYQITSEGVLAYEREGF